MQVIALLNQIIVNKYAKATGTTFEQNSAKPVFYFLLPSK